MLLPVRILALEVLRIMVQDIFGSVKRRGFIAATIGLMVAPSYAKPFAVTNRKIIVTKQTANLRKRIMRMSTLRESQLIKFRSLLNLTLEGDDAIRSVLMGPFTSVDRFENGMWSWNVARLQACTSFTAHGMCIVDDEGYFIKTVRFRGGNQPMCNGDELRGSYAIKGISTKLPLRDWPPILQFEDFTVGPYDKCDRVDVAQYVAHDCAISNLAPLTPISII